MNDTTVEFYTSGLPPSMDMFIKRDEKGSLNESFEEAIKVEKYLLSMHGKIEMDDKKLITSSKKTGTQTKIPGDKKEQDFPDKESMAKIIKKLYNDVIDLNTMTSKINFRALPKPTFRHYGNPPTNKNITPMEEAHLGKLINFIKSNHNNADDPKEGGGDPKQDNE